MFRCTLLKIDQFNSVIDRKLAVLSVAEISLTISCGVALYCFGKLDA